MRWLNVLSNTGIQLISWFNQSKITRTVLYSSIQWNLKMEIWKCSSLNSTLNKLNDCNLHKDEILKPSNHALPFLQLIQLLSLTKNKTLHFFGKLFNLESSSRVKKRTQILENRNSNVKSETFSNPKVKSPALPH